LERDYGLKQSVEEIKVRPDEKVLEVLEALEVSEDLRDLLGYIPVEEPDQREGVVTHVVFCLAGTLDIIIDHYQTRWSIYLEEISRRNT
jgi:hypothetical protein